MDEPKKNNSDDITYEINKRIIQFINTEGFTPSQFADYLGIPRSRITHIKNGRNRPNIQFIVLLLEKFPNLNPDWLLRGEGSMYKVPPHKASENEVEASETKKTKKQDGYQNNLFDTFTDSTFEQNIHNDNSEAKNSQNKTLDENISNNISQPSNTEKVTQAHDQPQEQNACEQTPQNINSNTQQQQAAAQTQPPEPTRQPSVPGSAPQPQNQNPQPVIIPGDDGMPAQILILYPDRTFVAYRARE